MERPSFCSIYMGFAKLLARRSTCSRAQVGAVIVDEDFHRVLSLGYNGGARGGFNECLSDEPGKCGHLHAEANAIIKLDFNDPCRKILFSTTFPCFNCSVMLINARISEVIYDKEYRSAEGKALLEKAGVRVWRFQEEEACDQGHPPVTHGPA